MQKNRHASAMAQTELANVNERACSPARRSRTSYFCKNGGGRRHHFWIEPCTVLLRSLATPAMWISPAGPLPPGKRRPKASCICRKQRSRCRAIPLLWAEKDSGLYGETVMIDVHGQPGAAIHVLAEPGARAREKRPPAARHYRLPHLPARIRSRAGAAITRANSQTSCTASSMAAISKNTSAAIAASSRRAKTFARTRACHRPTATLSSKAYRKGILR